nr:MAG TPA: hypothetical protein [Caudoviricetes sp.]
MYTEALEWLLTRKHRSLIQAQRCFLYISLK